MLQVAYQAKVTPEKVTSDYHFSSAHFQSVRSTVTTLFNTRSMTRRNSMGQGAMAAPPYCKLHLGHHTALELLQPERQRVFQ